MSKVSVKSRKTSQVLFGFASLCSVIGPENSHHPVNQSDLKANRDLDNGVCPRSRHCHLTQILTESGFWADCSRGGQRTLSAAHGKFQK